MFLCVLDIINPVLGRTNQLPVADMHADLIDLKYNCSCMILFLVMGESVLEKSLNKTYEELKQIRN